MLEKLKSCPFCGGDVKIINAEELTINHHRSGGEQVVANCKDCIHVEVCRYYTNELAKANGIPLKVEEIEGLLECDDCEHFKDRSRFVELPVKPGEKVFYFDTVGRIYETTVTQLVYGASGFLIDSDVMFNSNLIGKRFFLTREAAEQALKLKEREGGA